MDLVSGATYSSRGIQNAVKQALENAKKATNGETVPDNGTSSDGTTTIPEGKFPYEEGIYYGTGEGYLGDIQRQLSFRMRHQGKLSDQRVKMTKHS